MQICEYCHSTAEETATKCLNCGAALAGDTAIPPDFRACPHCHRRLLALGSPACNYCGQALPLNYIRARETMWQHVSEINAAPQEDNHQALHEVLKTRADHDSSALDLLIKLSLGNDD
jgi:RNA polymerase subunit RPABC4/transcription elongation factor Spt4